MTDGRIHILHVTQCLDLGGLETLIIELCKHADRKRYQVSVLCFNGYDEIYKTLLADYGIPVYLISKKGKYDISFFARAARFVRKIRADVIHTHGGCFFYSSIIGKLAGAGHLIYTVHGMPVNRGWRHKLEDFISCALTDNIVAVSEEVNRYMKENFRVFGDKMAIIINGIDTNKFRPIGNTYAVLEKKTALGIPGHKKIVGSVGRQENVKNYPMLLKAFAELVHSYEDDLHLTLVGDGGESASLKRLSAELNVSEHVSFLGMQYDMPSIYPLFDVFALSSFTEGTSLSLLEAQSCGVPAVVTDVGGNSNIIRDGVNGFLCGSGDYAGMAEKMDRLVNSDELRSTMGMLGRQLIENDFGLNLMLKRYDELYQRSRAGQTRQCVNVSRCGQLET